MDFQAVHEAKGKTLGYIRPNDVSDYTGTFGSFEVEDAAKKLVTFFQQKDRWHFFTLNKLRKFYKMNGWDPNTMLFGLAGASMRVAGVSLQLTYPKIPYVVFIHGGKLAVTTEFIAHVSKNISAKQAA